MNDNSDLLPNLAHEDAFEMQMRGYSRRQVDEFIARCRSQIRDLEQRLARALDEREEMQRDLSTARQQALGAKPAHEEVSERISQILKLADDEARSQKTKAHEDIARQRERCSAGGGQGPRRGPRAGRADADRGPGAGRAGDHLRAGRGGEDGRVRPGRGRAGHLRRQEEVRGRAGRREGAGQEGTGRGHGPGHRHPRRRRAAAEPAVHQALGDHQAADRHPGRRVLAGHRRGRPAVAGGRGRPEHGQDDRRARGGRRRAPGSGRPERAVRSGGPAGPGSGGAAGSAAAAASRTGTQPLPVSASTGSASPVSASTVSASTCRPARGRPAGAGTTSARPAPGSPPQSPAQQAEDKRAPVRATAIDSDDTKPNGVRVMPGSDK